MSKVITSKFLTSLNFKVMDKFDKQGFWGCESPVPLLAETEEYLIILDGAYCEVYDLDMELVDSRDNIFELLGE
jgi:hypothetical protein